MNNQPVAAFTVASGGSLRRIVAMPESQDTPQMGAIGNDSAEGDAVAPTVSVVIPVLNGASTIGAQLEALVTQKTSQPFEIIVADNGSTDTTRKIVAAYCGRRPEVRMIDASYRRGVNVARNAGIRAARAEKLLFCDADDIAAPGYIEMMSRALDQADGVAGTIDYRRLSPHLQKPPCSALFREKDVPVPLGACCGWRRELLMDIGGYDEAWIIGGDDIELALRAARAGAHVVHVPDAVLHKRERASKRDLARQYFKYGKARARLIKTFSDMAERRTLRSAASEWARLIRKAIRGQTDDRTVRRMAHNLGRIAGSIKYRCWAP